LANRKFWEGKKVLITGHTGFKGSWLSVWLQNMKADLVGYSLAPPTKPSFFEIANIHKGMKSIIADVRNFELLKTTIDEWRPDIIIHMAAQSVVRYSYQHPIETYSTNVMGTVNLLEAIRQSRIPCVIVNVTSDKCYDSREWFWGYREIDTLGGNDPYSNSKGCSELVTSGFRESYFNQKNACNHQVAIATARAGNVIGGGDWTSDQLIPDIIRAFIAGKAALIRSPESIRPWQFVLDALGGYLCLAEKLVTEKGKFSEAWNFGPDSLDSKPVAWIVDELCKLWGEGACWQLDVGIHPRETHMLKLDSSKARWLLGWRPVLPLPTGLKWVVEWYKGYQRGEDMREIAIRQISQYEEMIK
jgi:CDP-glucose 4,6-dehydratase